ncbi:MAG: nucleoside hydrolase [Bacteroidales bacterium]|nr:nucleoside hydrolase [Bacteroidales bacterium]
MKKGLFWLILALLPVVLQAHPWKAGHYVIVDTDGGLDDFRTICMLLASPDIRVLAITTSTGVLDAKATYHKVKSLLIDLHHQGLPVGCFFDQKAGKKGCMPALDFKWGASPCDTLAPPDAVSLVSQVLDNLEGEKIDYLCLGGLSSIHAIFQYYKGFHEQVERILWSSPMELNARNFNFSIDTGSLSNLLAQKLPLVSVNTVSYNRYDDRFTDMIKNIPGIHAQKVFESLNIKETPYSKAFFDESLALFLHFPSLFRCDTLNTLIGYQLNESTTADEIHMACKSILWGETVNHNQVLEFFPMDTAYYYHDVQEIADIAIKKYGREEWIAGVMANEMHRHLGIYAIIGVKMGLRAKEYFRAGIDEMTVLSYAGIVPPFSCMNDGLQISTGATLGHGLIKIAAEDLRLPMADFTYMNRTIRVTLRDDIRNKIEGDIRELTKIYGLDSDIYWELVRMKAIRYWQNFDRNEIFSIEER